MAGAPFECLTALREIEGVARPTEKKEGGNKSRLWIPACAGMTKTLIGRKAKSPSVPLYQRGREDEKGRGDAMAISKSCEDEGD